MQQEMVEVALVPTRTESMQSFSHIINISP